MDPRSRTRIGTKSKKSFVQAWLAKREMAGQNVRSADRLRADGAGPPQAIGFMPNRHIFCFHRRSKARQFTLEAEVFIR